LQIHHGNAVAIGQVLEWLVVVGKLLHEFVFAVRENAQIPPTVHDRSLLGVGVDAYFGSVEKVSFFQIGLGGPIASQGPVSPNTLQIHGFLEKVSPSCFEERRIPHEICLPCCVAGAELSENMDHVHYLFLGQETKNELGNNIQRNFLH